MNIVLVEDDEDDIYFFRKACQEIDSKIELTILRNGIELVEHVLKYGVNGKVFIVDLNMPKMGGLEALNKIKSFQSLSQMVVLIYTTSSSEHDIKEAMEIGVKSYLLKPDSLGKIKELVSSTADFWFNENNASLYKNER